MQLFNFALAASAISSVVGAAVPRNVVQDVTGPVVNIKIVGQAVQQVDGVKGMVTGQLNEIQTLVTGTVDKSVVPQVASTLNSVTAELQNVVDFVSPSIKKQTTNSGWKPNSANETETPTPDKKKSETVALEKKRSAADFLKRIKQNSPAETTKRNGRGGSSNKSNAAAAAAAAGEQKKGSGKNGGKEKASSIRQSNEKKRLKEDPSPSKRSVGRPPKKAVEANPDPNPAPTKRAREGGGKEPLKRARKRARR